MAPIMNPSAPLRLSHRRHPDTDDCRGRRGKCVHHRDSRVSTLHLCTTLVDSVRLSCIAFGAIFLVISWLSLGQSVSKFYELDRHCGQYP